MCVCVCLKMRYRNKTKMRDLKIFFSDNTQKYYLDIASIQGKIYTGYLQLWELSKAI